MELLHRILIGAPGTDKQLRVAGLFVVVWFGMDLVEFVDWAVQKYRPAPISCNNYYAPFFNFPNWDLNPPEGFNGGPL